MLYCLMRKKLIYIFEEKQSTTVLQDCRYVGLFHGSFFLSLRMGLYLMKSNFTANTHIGENWFWQEQILANFLTNRKKIKLFGSFMSSLHWTRSFRNHNACGNCNIHCLQDVETQCIVSNSNLEKIQKIISLSGNNMVMNI